MLVEGFLFLKKLMSSLASSEDSRGRDQLPCQTPCVAGVYSGQKLNVKDCAVPILMKRTHISMHLSDKVM